MSDSDEYDPCKSYDWEKNDITPTSEDCNFLLPESCQLEKETKQFGFESHEYQRQCKKKFEREFTVFIFQIPFTVSEDELRYFLEKYVKLQSFHMKSELKDRSTKKFAFATVTNEHDFKMLLEMDNMMVDGRPVKIRKSEPRPKPYQKSKIQIVGREYASQRSS